MAELALGKMLDRSRNLTGRSMPYLRNLNVRWGRFDLEDLAQMRFEDHELARFGVRAGDVLVCEGGEPGRAAVWSGADGMVMFQKALHRVRPGPGLDPRWIALQLQHDAGMQGLEHLFTGSTIRHLTGASLRRYPVVLAPLREQRRIVAKVEALRARARGVDDTLAAVPALLDRLHQSILAAAFRGDLTAQWRARHPEVEPADERLEQIRAERRRRWEAAESARLTASGKTPTDDRWRDRYAVPRSAQSQSPLPPTWTWARWEEIGCSQNGRGFPSEHYAEHGCRLLRPGNLTAPGVLSWTASNTRFMPEAWAGEYADYLVNEGDLIINLTAQSLKDEFLGRICQAGPGERCLLNQRIARLSPVGVEPRFVFWHFKSPLFRRFVDGLNQGSVIQHMFTSQIDDYTLPIPPRAEQRVLCALLDRWARFVDGVRAALPELARRREALDRAILARALRGELVAQDPNDEPASVLLDRLRAGASEWLDRPA